MLSGKTPLKRTGFLKRSKLSPVSAKRRKESAIYAKKRKVFLALHPWCEWWLAIRNCTHTTGGLLLKGEIWIDKQQVPRSCDIHHKAGRSGTNYLDESTWMAVSREGHKFIHNNPKFARQKGWLI